MCRSLAPCRTTACNSLSIRIVSVLATLDVLLPALERLGGEPTRTKLAQSPVYGGQVFRDPTLWEKEGLFICQMIIRGPARFRQATSAPPEAPGFCPDGASGS